MRHTILLFNHDKLILSQIVVDFTVAWCGPCRFISPFLADLVKKLPNVTFLKLDIDELKVKFNDWAVEAMPTFMFIKEGNMVDIRLLELKLMNCRMLSPNTWIVHQPNMHYFCV
ncbi:hypothetical protein MTR67_011477 [Solanum verrucosum]|uniref:Thioredoxin domain-containing protein n=1 Tax=Solanum verrucosum TaxID=315347 RepID=A0AAF0Q841_SOLVR|nr:hypothetical protein MTR67_011477 [Solanum verrucosum]